MQVRTREEGEGYRVVRIRRNEGWMGLGMC